MTAPLAAGNRSDQSGRRPAKSRLRPNAVGVLGIVFFVLSAQAPLTGVAGAGPIVIGIGDGAGAPGAYLLVGILIAVFAVGFIAMSRHVTDAGAFYAYIGKGLGRRAATASAFTALWSYSSIQAAMYGLYGIIVKGLLSHYLQVNVAWWVCTIVTMAVIQAFGSLSISLGARILAVLVVGEMSILIAFAFAVLFSGGGPQGLDVSGSFAPSIVLSGAPGVAIMFAIASMFGFESTAIYSEEAKDPVKTVPRATYLSVAIISVFFAFVTWMVVAYYGTKGIVAAASKALESGDATTLIFSAASDKLGNWAGDALGILLASSLLAGILAFHNAINRYVYSLGHHGTLPTVVTKVNGHSAPYVAAGLQTLLALIIVVPFVLLDKDPILTLFSWMSGVAVLALMLLYFLTSVSVVVFFRRTKLDTRLWQTVIAPVVSAVLVLGTAYLIINNFTTLIGGSQKTANWLMFSVPAVFILGLILSSLTHTRDTETVAAKVPPPATVGPH